MENLYSGRTNLSTNLKPLTVATDAKAKLEEIDDKFRKLTTQIDEDEQRRAKRIGNWNAVKATNYQTAMTNLRLWDKAFDGLGKGMEAYFEQDAKKKAQEVIEGGHTFESDPLNMSKLLEHGELLKALENGQIKAQETAEKLNELGLTEAAERYVSLSDYNKRGIDFAYMQNKASTADRNWPGWLEQNQGREWSTIGPDGKPTTFTAENYNKLLPSQQQQILTSYGHDITKGVGVQYDAATREKYLLAPVRKWREQFLDTSATKSTVIRAREHIELKTQFVQTSINEAIVSGDFSLARSALINWRAATKFQWSQLEQEGQLGGKKVGEVITAKQEELFKEILDNAGHENAMLVLENLIKPVVQTKQYEQIPVTDAKGNVVTDTKGRIVYTQGKRLLPFGESLDANDRFSYKEMRIHALGVINKSWDADQKGKKAIVESYINNKFIEFQDGAPPSMNEKQKAVTDFVDENPWVLNNPALVKKLNKLRDFKPGKLSVKATTQKLNELHARYGKMWPTGELGNLDINNEQVENYRETHGISYRDTEWGNGADKDLIITAQNRLKAAIGYNKTLGFDRKNGEPVFKSAWLAVQMQAQRLQRDYEQANGVKVSDSEFINQVTTEEIEKIELGANDTKSQYYKTPYGYENYDRNAFFDDRADLISPKYANQMETYLKAKSRYGIGGLRNVLFLENHPELLVKTTTQVPGTQGGELEISYHPVLCVMARNMGVLPSTLYESQTFLRNFHKGGQVEEEVKTPEQLYIENNFPEEALLDLNNMQRLGGDKNFFNRTLNQNVDFPWGYQPLEDLLGDWPAVQGIDKDQAFLKCKEQPNRGLAFRTYCRETRPGIDIATENGIINYLHSMGMFNV